MDFNQPQNIRSSQPLLFALQILPWKGCKIRKSRTWILNQLQTLKLSECQSWNFLSITPPNPNCSFDNRSTFITFSFTNNIHSFLWTFTRNLFTINFRAVFSFNRCKNFNWFRVSTREVEKNQFTINFTL